MDIVHPVPRPPLSSSCREAKVQHQQHKRHGATVAPTCCASRKKFTFKQRLVGMCIFLVVALMAHSLLQSTASSLSDELLLYHYSVVSSTPNTLKISFETSEATVVQSTSTSSPPPPLPSKEKEMSITNNMTKDNPSAPTAVQSETTSHVSQESATRVTNKQETSTESSTAASSLSSNVDGAHENVTSESSGRPPSKPSRRRKKKKRRRHRDPKPAPVPNPKTLLPGIPERRSERYPSVEERVRIYMGAWYLPPCKKYDDEADSNNMSTIIYYQYNYTQETVMLTAASRNEQGRAQRPPEQKVLTTAGPRLFFAKQSNYDSCRETYKDERDVRYIEECLDVHRTIPRNLLWSKEDRKAEEELRLNSALRNTTSTQTLSQPPPPILLRIDDRGHPQKVPTFHYCRKAYYNGEIDDLTKKQTCSSAATGEAMIDPIVWNLYSYRYFGPLYKIANEDRDWNDKIDAAVFRGAITGGPAHSDELLFGSDPEINRLFEAESNDTAKCLQIPRCRLVYFYANSTRIDAGLTEHKLAHAILKEPTNVSGGNLLASDLSMKELLKYKMLILIDGNDMASGLKWGLLSRSVVMMPRTRYTSYAMDELMRPFVHYVPLKDDLSNVEEMIQWVLDHDEEAQQIAHRGSLWIQDLVFHPDAERDNELICTEILERYSAHFAPLPTSG
ncbi:hypothetical protein ACA910_021094 [Epithemia clementina (nom. ined.)]